MHELVAPGLYRVYRHFVNFYVAVEGGENLRVLTDHCHRGAEITERSCHLEPDRSRPDHDQAPRKARKDEGGS